MTERERQRNRLIEILKHDLCDEQPRVEGESGCKSCPYHHLMTETTTCFEVRYADLLLREGVIVPPCKVGDTVYALDDIVWDSECCDCEHYLIGGFGDPSECARTRHGRKHPACIEIKKRTVAYKDILRYMCFDDFGETVFLTKEEAEKALAERSEGK